MITYEVAYHIANLTILNISTKHNFVILEDKTIERDFGWVFFYVTKEYLETMNPKFLVPGTAPVVVHKKDGSVLHLPTSLPPMRAIEEYEKEWNRL